MGLLLLLRLMEKAPPSTVQQLRQEPNIKRALEDTAATETTTSKAARTPLLDRRTTTKVAVYAGLFLLAGGAYYLLQLRVLMVPTRFGPVLLRGLSALMIMLAVLTAARLLKTLLLRRLDTPVIRYNLGRIVDLVVALLVLFTFVSVFFVNWYAAAVSFGLISLVLGLALQNPITSFFAWIYILLRKPYAVGDRIKIGSATGDVIELGYFDTTLWEFNGDYLSGDHPSGRVIRFANSRVFSDYVYNYSWPLFPYIWNEIKFHLAYESDLTAVSHLIQGIVEAEIGEEMMARVALYRELLAETPVDAVEVRARPSISFRATDNTWLEVVVRYLVEPKQAGAVKNRLFPRLLTELRAHPEAALFPKTNMR